MLRCVVEALHRLKDNPDPTRNMSGQLGIAGLVGVMMTRYILWPRCLSCSCGRVPSQAMTTQERRQYLEKLLQILPDVPSFRQWLREDRRTSAGFRCLPEDQWPARSAEVSGWQACSHGRRMEVAPRRDPATLREVRPGHVPA